MDILNIIENLRSDVIKYREEKKQSYVSPDICSVEIAINIVEFCLKRNRQIHESEEIWFKASFYLANGLDGTEWENLYLAYKSLVDYVEKHDYFRKEIPIVKW